jgi:hypothetical protein
MKESIEHQKSSSSIKKGNENKNVNTINIKNSINLGDLVKKIKAKSKPRKKGGGGGGGGGADQIIEQIQGAPGMPGQAGAPGMPGIDATPNQPFFPSPSSSNSTIPSYMSNTTVPQDFQASNSVAPSYVSNTTVPQLSQIAQTLENDTSLYERARKLAEDFGVPIPESLRTISSASNAQPNNPTQLKAVDDEVKNETQEILDRLPNVPLDRSGSSQSISTGTLDKLYSNSLPIKTTPDIFSSSTGARNLENISSNSTKAKVSGIMPPTPFSSSEFIIPPLQERLRLQSRERELRKEQNQLESMKNAALKEKPRNIEKIKEIDNKIKDIRKSRYNNLPIMPAQDNNSTQSGLQLARSDSNTSVGSSVLPPRPPPRMLNAPEPSINNFFSDVLALKNAPVKTQKQILRDIVNEPLNIQEYVPPNQTARTQPKVRPPRVRKNDYFNPLELDPLVEDITQFRKDIERSRNIPPQSSLLEQITMQKPKPNPPPERNLLGQAFGAFSNLLSGSRGARDAAGYGALALGAVQPELLPAIAAAETANQVLNIIEAPVNAIERSIQAYVPPSTRKRKDAYGGF